MQSLDNLSVVMIGLKGFRNSLEKAWEAKNAPANAQAEKASPV